MFRSITLGSPNPSWQAELPPGHESLAQIEPGIVRQKAVQPSGMGKLCLTCPSFFAGSRPGRPQFMCKNLSSYRHQESHAKFLRLKNFGEVRCIFTPKRTHFCLFIVANYSYSSNVKRRTALAGSWDTRPRIWSAWSSVLWSGESRSLHIS